MKIRFFEADFFIFAKNTIMDLRPNARRAKQAIILIWVVLGFELLGLISDYMQYQLLIDLNSGGMYDESEVDGNDLRQRIIAISYLVALIVSAVFYIRWFRRAFFNLEQRVNDLRFDSSDVAPSFFIPFLSLYKPYQIMKEMFRRTEDYLAANVRGYMPSFKFHSIGWWWALWIANTIAGQVAFRLSRKADTMDSLMNGTIANMVGEIIGIPLALIAILVIQDYAEKERMLETVSPEDNPDTPSDDTETIAATLLPEA